MQSFGSGEPLLLAKSTLSAAQLGPGFGLRRLDSQRRLNLLFGSVISGLTSAQQLILFGLDRGEHITRQSSQPGGLSPYVCVCVCL